MVFLIARAAGPQALLPFRYSDAGKPVASR